MNRISVLNRKVGKDVAGDRVSERVTGGKKKSIKRAPSESPSDGALTRSLSLEDSGRLSASVSDYVQAAWRTIDDEARVRGLQEATSVTIEKLRQEAAVSLNLEIDLKAEKRVNDEVHLHTYMHTYVSTTPVCCMCIYIYICIRIYIYIYIYFVCICIDTYVGIQIYIYKYMYM